MGPMNSAKKCSGFMNSSKNKLNSKIILIFNLHPNTPLVSSKLYLIIFLFNKYTYKRHIYSNTNTTLKVYNLEKIEIRLSSLISC